MPFISMKICIPIWKESVSTAFDFAATLCFVQHDNGKVTSRDTVDVQTLSLAEKVTLIRDAGVDVVMCGCISRPAAAMIELQGIQLIPWVRGRIDDVLSAYDAGTIEDHEMRIPGCRRMEGKGHGRRGGGYGHGHGRGRGAGVDTHATCLCPGCGATMPHIPGHPCVERLCPSCGARMIRMN